MPIQYQPFPEFQVPNVNLLGAYAQGAALQQQQLQEEPEASYVKWVQHHAADGQFVPRSEWDLFASHRNKSKKKED